MDFSNVEALNLPFDTLITLSFYFVIGMYAIFSGILYYHWNAYGTDARITTLTLLIFFGTTLPLIVVMGIIVFII